MDHFDRLRAMNGNSERSAKTEREHCVFLHDHRRLVITIVDWSIIEGRLGHQRDPTPLDRVEEDFVCPRCGASIEWMIQTLDYGFYEGVFTGVADCCQPVMCAGWYEGDPERPQLATFRLLDPPYSLLDVPIHIDPGFMDLGWAAGRVLWEDAEAAANKLRIALELFASIALARAESGGSRLTASAGHNLNASLQLLTSRGLLKPGSFEDAKMVSDRLHEIRKIGNNGSHGQVVLNSKVIEAGEVLSAIVTDNLGSGET